MNSDNKLDTMITEKDMMEHLTILEFKVSDSPDLANANNLQHSRSQHRYKKKETSKVNQLAQEYEKLQRQRSFEPIKQESSQLHIKSKVTKKLQNNASVSKNLIVTNADDHTELLKTQSRTKLVPNKKKSNNKCIHENAAMIENQNSLIATEPPIMNANIVGSAFEAGDNAKQNYEKLKQKNDNQNNVLAQKNAIALDNDSNATAKDKQAYKNFKKINNQEVLTPTSKQRKYDINNFNIVKSKYKAMGYAINFSKKYKQWNSAQQKNVTKTAELETTPKNTNILGLKHDVVDNEIQTLKKHNPSNFNQAAIVTEAADCLRELKSTQKKTNTVGSANEAVKGIKQNLDKPKKHKKCNPHKVVSQTAINYHEPEITANNVNNHGSSCEDYVVQKFPKNFKQTDEVQENLPQTNNTLNELKLTASNVKTFELESEIMDNEKKSFENAQREQTIKNVINQATSFLNKSDTNPNNSNIMGSEYDDSLGNLKQTLKKLKQKTFNPVNIMAKTTDSMELITKHANSIEPVAEAVSDAKLTIKKPKYKKIHQKDNVTQTSYRAFKSTLNKVGSIHAQDDLRQVSLKQKKSVSENVLQPTEKQSNAIGLKYEDAKQLSKNFKNKNSDQEVVTSKELCELESTSKNFNVVKSSSKPKNLTEKFKHWTVGQQENGTKTSNGLHELESTKSHMVGLQPRGNVMPTQKKPRNLIQEGTASTSNYLSKFESKNSKDIHRTSTSNYLSKFEAKPNNNNTIGTSNCKHNDVKQSNKNFKQKNTMEKDVNEIFKHLLEQKSSNTFGTASELASEVKQLKKKNSDQLAVARLTNALHELKTTTKTANNFASKSRIVDHDAKQFYKQFKQWNATQKDILSKTSNRLRELDATTKNSKIVRSEHGTIGDVSRKLKQRKCSQLDIITESSTNCHELKPTTKSVYALAAGSGDNIAKKLPPNNNKPKKTTAQDNVTQICYCFHGLEPHEKKANSLHEIKSNQKNVNTSCTDNCAAMVKKPQTTQNGKKKNISQSVTQTSNILSELDSTQKLNNIIGTRCATLVNEKQFANEFKQDKHNHKDIVAQVSTRVHHYYRESVTKKLGGTNPDIVAPEKPRINASVLSKSRFVQKNAFTKNSKKPVEPTPALPTAACSKLDVNLIESELMKPIIEKLVLMCLKDLEDGVKLEQALAEIPEKIKFIRSVIFKNKKSKRFISII